MALLQQFLLVLSFLTRIPLPKAWNAGENSLAQSAWAFPIIGVIVGGFAAASYMAMLSLGIGHDIAAWVALALMVLLTGGLHEDGLADMADGLAYGRTQEQKIAIMRDSRIGSYGVLALVIMLAIRATAISNFANEMHTLWVFVAAGAGSRACLIILMYFFANARTNGLSVQARKPTRTQMLCAALIGFGTLLFAGSIPVLLIGIFIMTMACMAMGRLAFKHFGGITGDVLGALQQVSEALLLILFSSALL